MSDPGTRHVLLGVTGGIAASKALDLVRTLREAHVEVTVLQTRAATTFVDPAAFEQLTGTTTITDEWAWSQAITEAPPVDQRSVEDLGKAAAGTSGFPHLDAARWADVFVIVPATANVIAKLAQGIADDVLTTAALAYTGTVVIAPAMNTQMWRHPATQRNVEQLASDGVQFVDPESGLLACGEVGEGRLAGVDVIAGAIEAALDERASVASRGRDLDGLKVLVTAGGTREPIDSVRYIGNRSSGRMGVAVAQAAAARGAEVRLVVTGSVDAGLYRGLDPAAVVDSVSELSAAVDQHSSGVDVVVMAAAVSDFTVASAGEGKLERGATTSLELEPTADIVGGMGARREGPSPVLVAFAAESGTGGLARAHEKLKRKAVDLVVFNDVSRADIGFDTTENEVTIVDATGGETHVPKATKRAIADAILDRISVQMGTLVP